MSTKKRNIVIGVCGSIAAYKSAEVVRGFKKKGWNVQVVMTEESMNFIAPLTLSTLSERRIYSEMFEDSDSGENHISISDSADVILVVPATANIIGKIAGGICDDLLTCIIFAFNGPVVLAPAMNDRMWENPIIQDNFAKLKKNGYHFIGPEKGKLASGKEGIGRLVDVEKIVEYVEKITL
jgi:phosphopantothenoylcysteine synthetase/decarboxylase